MTKPLKQAAAMPAPTDGELAILQVLWSRGPSTVRQVLDQMDRDTKYTTVLKLMQIMTEKGWCGGMRGSGRISMPRRCQHRRRSGSCCGTWWRRHLRECGTAGVAGAFGEAGDAGGAARDSEAAG